MSRHKKVQEVTDIAVEVIYSIYSSIRRKHEETKGSRLEQEKTKQQLKAEAKAAKQAARAERRHPFNILKKLLWVGTIIYGIMALFGTLTPVVAGLAVGVTLAMAVSGGILLAAAGVFFIITGNRRYKLFTSIRGKGIFTYFIDKGIFIKDPSFWTFTAVWSFYTSSMPTEISGGLLYIYTLAIPVYLFFSVYLNMNRLDPSMPAVTQKIPPEPDPDALEKMVKPAPVVAQCEISVTEQLLVISDELQDKKLIENVKIIVGLTGQIDEALKKYPNERKKALIREYSAQLLQFLNIYNEAEDLGLTNKEALSMMENTREYTAELVVVFRNLLEAIHSTNVERIDANIDAMRKEIRMRGLVD